MPPRKAGSDERLDELYREQPGGFVAGRNRLVKELRDAGDREEAERVSKLRRPTAAAWLINRAALVSPAELEDFGEASRRLAEAQSRALDGEDEAIDEWRAAARREQAATVAVLGSAERAARDAGHPASDRALELAGETLRAAAGDDDLRRRVLAGRVEREQDAATLGIPAGAATRRGRGAQKRRERAQAGRELERLEAQLADARTREAQLRAAVEDSTEALKRAKSRLRDGRREVAELERHAKAARKRARD